MHCLLSVLKLQALVTIADTMLMVKCEIKANLSRRIKRMAPLKGGGVARSAFIFFHYFEDNGRKIIKGCFAIVVKHSCWFSKKIVFEI